MARFSSIIYVCILTLAAAAAQAQTVRPAPMNGQPPNANQQLQPNGRELQQQVPQQPANQPPANQQQNAPNPSQQPNPQPQVALPPDTPPTPPEVTYRDGMLTVHAINSTLGSVISAIKTKTGIEFDGAENSPDRVAISQGPAPSGEVLASIFAGSKYDFVAIGRPDSPNVVQRVILSPKKAMGATMAAQKPVPANAGEGDDDDTPDETVNAGDPQDTPAQPPQSPQAQQQQPQPQNQQPKTPDQLLQELQQMQKQQQQQQQGDPNQNPSQVPRKPTPP